MALAWPIWKEQNKLQTDTIEAGQTLVIAAADTQATAAGPPKSRFWIVNTFRAHPELAIFLTLAIGYWVGALTFGSFSLGAVTGTLLVGVLIGQMDIAISDNVKSLFFLMFLFAVGYGVGPQFVRGIAHDGAHRST